MIHDYVIEGIKVATGDILCTTDGGKGPSFAAFLWRCIGMVIPGEVDHILIYVGPGGRCVEALGFGITETTLAGGRWNPAAMRGGLIPLVDTLYGAASPIKLKTMTEAEEKKVREGVAAYCLAKAGKPYNFNFFNPSKETAFYCSQLAYRAYLNYGIDLNAGARRFWGVPCTERIVLPQTLWDVCEKAGAARRTK